MDVLALVLAGGRGSRMGVLTQDRAKPALPFAGTYRLLDFSLSNLRHSGIDDVWVLVQFETQSILDVLAGGRPWDLDRSHGGRLGSGVLAGHVDGKADHQADHQRDDTKEDAQYEVLVVVVLFHVVLSFRKS